jgi:hypothetical protein
MEYVHIKKAYLKKKLRSVSHAAIRSSVLGQCISLAPSGKERVRRAAN